MGDTPLLAAGLFILKNTFINNQNKPRKIFSSIFDNWLATLYHIALMLEFPRSTHNIA